MESDSKKPLQKHEEKLRAKKKLSQALRKNLLRRKASAVDEIKSNNK